MKLFLFTLMLVFSTTALADKKHHHGHHEHVTIINNITEVTNVTNVTEGVNETFVTNNSTELQHNFNNISGEYMAGTMAVANLDFSSSTKQWQVGAAIGFYGNQEAIAVGVGKLVPDWDMMFRASITPTGSHTAFGIGATWKIP